MNQFEVIREWASDRGILSNATPKDQFLKLAEEVGELANSIAKDNHEEFVDAIGDCVVVLTILASLKGLLIENCIHEAIETIIKRQGQMINGVFVKEKT